MLNETYAATFRLLRLRAGLTQEGAGAILGVSRHKIIRFEKGEARPTRAQEEKLLEVSRCSRIELGEVVCEALTPLIGRRVTIDGAQSGHVPTTEISMLDRLLRDHAAELTAAESKDSADRLHAIQLLAMAYERQLASLKQHVCKLREKLAKKGGAAAIERSD